MVLKQRLSAVVAALSILISGDAVRSRGLADGGAVVVAGHSFHAPTAVVLKRIASSAGAGEAGVVFVSGAWGTIGSLWRNQSRRDQILGKIEQLDAAVLVLPSVGWRGDEATALAGWVEAGSAIRADITIVLNSVHPPSRPADVCRTILFGRGTGLRQRAFSGFGSNYDLPGLFDPVGHLNGRRLNPGDLQMILNGIAIEAARIEENPRDSSRPSLRRRRN